MDDAAGGLAFLGEELTQEHEFVETFPVPFRETKPGLNRLSHARENDDSSNNESR